MRILTFNIVDCHYLGFLGNFIRVPHIKIFGHSFADDYWEETGYWCIHCQVHLICR